MTDVDPVAAAPQEHTYTESDRRFFLRVAGVALFAALGYLVYLIVSPLWQPLAWAALLGAVLAPLNARLTAKLGNRPTLASAVTTILTIVLFVLPVATIAATVASQAALLLRRLEEIVPRGTAGQDVALTDIPWLRRPLAWIGENTAFTLDQLQGWTIQGVKRLLEAVMSSSGSVVLGAVGTLVSFALMLFVLFFVLRDGRRFARNVVSMLPIEPGRRALLWSHLRDVTRAVFMGIGLTALVQGVLIAIGFWIAGLPSPLVFLVLGALFALVPFVGTTIIWGPGAIWLASQGEYGHAIFLAAWGVGVVGLADNFLRPFLISGRTEVPVLAVFIGVIGGLSAFGFIGLFVGPIVLSMLVAMFRFGLETRRAGAAQPDPT